MKRCQLLLNLLCLFRKVGFRLLCKAPKTINFANVSYQARLLTWKEIWASQLKAMNFKSLCYKEIFSKAQNLYIISKLLLVIHLQFESKRKLTAKITFIKMSRNLNFSLEWSLFTGHFCAWIHLKVCVNCYVLQNIHSFIWKINQDFNIPYSDIFSFTKIW